MGETGGKSGGGPDTPWTVTHDAAGFSLKNLKHLGTTGTPSLSTTVGGASIGFLGNGAANSDVFSRYLFVAPAAGVAANTVLFTVTLSTGLVVSSSQLFVAPFFTNSNTNSAGLNFYWLGDAGLGTAVANSFGVYCTTALPAVAQAYPVLSILIGA